MMMMFNHLILLFVIFFAVIGLIQQSDAYENYGNNFQWLIRGAEKRFAPENIAED